MTIYSRVDSSELGWGAEFDRGIMRGTIFTLSLLVLMLWGKGSWVWDAAKITFLAVAIFSSLWLVWMRGGREMHCVSVVDRLRSTPHPPLYHVPPSPLQGGFFAVNVIFTAVIFILGWYMTGRLPPISP